MTSLDYAILGLLAISVPILIFGWFVLHSAKKKVDEGKRVPVEDRGKEVGTEPQSAAPVHQVNRHAGRLFLALCKLNGDGYARSLDLLKPVASFLKSRKPELLKSEKKRLCNYFESPNYEKNRIALYAYDSSKEPDLKEPAEHLLSRLVRQYPNHDDPDHLIEIGKRAALKIPK